MAGNVLTASVQVPSDAEAPIRFDFELHALRVGLVARESINRLGEEWTKPGVYVLLGAVGASGKTTIYVGKAVDVRGRLLNHRRNPKLEWWRAMVVVRDTTHGFNSAQIGYLEGRLAQELRVRPSVDVREGQTTFDATIPTVERVPLDAFVDTTLEALRITGLDLRSEADEGSANEETTADERGGSNRQTVAGTVADLLSAGLLSAGTQLVAKRAGKTGAAEVTGSGALLVDGVSYGSPSKAAQKALEVQAANGWKSWTTTAGISLAALRDQLNAADEE